MRVEQWTDGDRVGFVILDPPADRLGRIQDLGFGEWNGGYVRWFPEDVADLDRAFAGFRRCVDEIVMQKAGLLGAPWAPALLHLLKATAGADVSWWLAGSTALAIRGIAVTPRDVDLVVDGDGARRLGTILRDHLVEPVAPVTGWIGGWWGRAFLGACVEWIGDVHPERDETTPSDFGPAAASRLETIAWRGHHVRVPPLDLSRAVSVRRGLNTRVAEIDRWLGENGEKTSVANGY